MSESGTTHSCPDCATEMHRVKLIGTTATPGEVHTVLCRYAAEQAQPHFFTRRFTTEGTVQAWMCDACGRVALYAEPQVDA